MESTASVTITLCPGREQRETMERTLKCCREIYNNLLDKCTDAWKSGDRPTPEILQDIAISMAKGPEYAGVSEEPVRETAHRLYDAFCIFMRRSDEGGNPGFPRYKSVRRYHSFAYAVGEHCGIEGNRISLEGIGEMLFVRSAEEAFPETGVPMTCVVKKASDGQWRARIFYGTEGDGGDVALRAAVGETGGDIRT